MAGYGSKDARLLIGGIEVQHYVDSVNVKVSAIMDSFHGLGDTFPTALDTGTKNAELTYTTLYDGVYSYLMGGTIGASPTTTLEIEGGVAGSRAYCWDDPIYSATEVVLAQDQMHRWNPEVTISGKVHNGFVAAPFMARTTAGSTDAADADGLASSTGATAFLHVASVTLGGYTNCIITPRSSADATTWGDCSAAFPAVTAAGAQSLALTGTVERYLSVSWSWTGAGTGQSITFAVYIARD